MKPLERAFRNRERFVSRCASKGLLTAEDAATISALNSVIRYYQQRQVKEVPRVENLPKRQLAMVEWTMKMHMRKMLKWKKPTTFKSLMWQLVP